MYSSILIPLDGSEYAAKALPQVAELAEKGTKITLLQVIHSIEELAESTFVADVEMSQDMAAREAFDREWAIAERKLAEARQLLSGHGYDVQVKVVDGAPADQILKVAQDTSAGLIVMTAYGLSASSTPSKTGVFGRVVDHVLKGASQPVLVVKPWANVLSPAGGSL